MGHYDDVIEEHEKREFKKRADSLGLTEHELFVKDRHEERMRKGKELFLKEQESRELIKYYLDNLQMGG